MFAVAYGWAEMKPTEVVIIRSQRVLKDLSKYFARILVSFSSSPTK